MTRTATRRPGRRTTRAGALAAPALILSMLGASPALAADAPFRAAPDLELGSSSRGGNAKPRAVAVGDFNSDGRQDLAIADPGLASVHVRLGKGDGTFEPANSIIGQSDVRDLAVGDFDADGDEDLVVAAQEAKTDGAAAVQIGNGDGTFTPGQTIELPGKVHANSVALGDFDADGKIDLAVAGGAHLLVSPGQGDGRFIGGADITLADSGPAAAVAADFEGDGRDDVAITLNGTQIGALRSRGDFTFDAVQRSPLPGTAAMLAVGDFDEDGRPDVAAPDGAGNRVLVRLGSGDARFAKDPGDVPTAVQPFGAAVGDFDGDGHEDLAVANVGGGVSVRLGAGDGTFRDGGEVTGRPAATLAAGDLDRDGAEDLAVAHPLSGVVAPLLGTSAAPLAGNLLVNGGFEQGPGVRVPGAGTPVPGWTTESGMTAARHGAFPHRGFPSWLDAARWSGGTNLLWGGLTGPSSAAQTVDVGGAAAAIDAGTATVRLSAELGGGLRETDHMTATASFLDGAGAALATLPVGPVTAEDRRGQTTLLRREAATPAPIGTRRIRVTLRASARAGAASSALADNVKLTLDAPPTGGSTAGGQAGGGTADGIAPALGRVTLAPAKFAVARGGTAVSAARRGTAVRYSLSEPATVTLRIERLVKGKRRTAGALRRTGAAGANRVRFSGRIGRRALRPGRYRLTVRATDAAGNRSAARSATFRVVR